MRAPAPLGRDKSPTLSLGSLGGIAQIRPAGPIGSEPRPQTGGKPIINSNCWKFYQECRHQPVKRAKCWRNLHEAVRMNRLREYEGAVEAERKAAIRNACAARSALWLEKDMARRACRRPDPRFARALLDAESIVDGLKRDARLYAEGRRALPTAPGPTPVGLPSELPGPVPNSDFHRHP